MGRRAVEARMQSPRPLRHSHDAARAASFDQATHVVRAPFREVCTDGEDVNEECELRVAWEMLGEERRTFYGETWDVKNMESQHRIHGSVSGCVQRPCFSLHLFLCLAGIRVMFLLLTRPWRSCGHVLISFARVLYVMHRPPSPLP